MSFVYITHVPLRLDRASGDMVQMFDMEAAKGFGELKYILPEDGNRPSTNPKVVLPILREALVGFKKTDYLAVVGDAGILVWAAALAMRATGGQIQLLKWSKHEHSYLISVAQVYDEVKV